MLKKLRDPMVDKNWSDVIERELETEGDIYVKVITVDGYVADSSAHDIIFQLGNDPPRYYRYLNGKFEPLKSLPKMKVEIEKA